jgi:hypothetical protein
MMHLRKSAGCSGVPALNRPAMAGEYFYYYYFYAPPRGVPPARFMR